MPFAIPVKKICIVLTVVVVLIVGALFITTKLSTAHAIASQSIRASSDISRHIGQTNHLLLASIQQQEGPSGAGCTTLGYIAIGSNDSEWVEVRMEKKSFKTDWLVIETIEGLNGSAQTECRAG
jgi:hypothetical protein